MAPMTNAERQKKYRERLKQNPAKYEELRLKHLDRVKKSKRNGIKNLNKQQKEITREKWRQYSARYYAKKKNKSNSEKSPDSDAQATNVKITNNQWISRTAKLQKKLRLCREALKLSLKKQESMRKQIYRLKQQILKIKEKNTTNEKDLSSKPSDFDILSESLGLIYKESSQKEKHVLKKVIKNPITSKRRITAKITKAVGIKGKIRSCSTKSAKRKLLVLEIRNFYLRDDISRPTAGKKECITKNNTKMQIRLLTDTIYNLFKIYKREGGKASYATLSRHCPFYVIPPKLQNRNTCACMRHSNIKYKILKLYTLGLIKTKQTDELLMQITCSLQSKECMYGQCESCATKKIEMEGLIDDTVISWLQWSVKKVPYKKKNQHGTEIEAFTQKCVKEVVTDNLSALKVKFQEEIVAFKKHIYNMTHQQKSFRECVDNVKENEAVIIVDFSENYLCKYNYEVQSMHFGSSRRQITLHTGVAYLNNEKPEPFCSISPNNEHSPLSIWAHLQPVLNNIKYQHPEIDTLHVFSDGPTTQYRQKLNFALFDRFTKQLDFQNASWSYFEASHGKTSADGIGGALKRTLDMCVAYGSDVSNATAAFKLLKQKTSVTLFYVSEKDIQKIKNDNPFSNVWPLVGTLTVHQIITTAETGKIRYRQVSCFCGLKRGNCSCFDIKEHNLLKKEKITNKVQKTVAAKLKVLKRQSDNETDSMTVKAGPSKILKNNDAFIKNNITGAKKRELVSVSSKNNVHKTVTVKSKGVKRQIDKDIDTTTVKAGQSKVLRYNIGLNKNKLGDKNKKELNSKSVSSRTMKNQNKNKNKGKTKITSFFDTSSSETEDEIVYAESEDSLMITDESHSELESQSFIKQKCNKKITILSDVKFNADNRRYLDLKTVGPSALHKIDTDFNLYQSHTGKPQTSLTGTGNADNSSDEENIFDSY